MGKKGSIAQITAAGSFDVFRGNGVRMFAPDASLFGLQGNDSEVKNIYMFSV
jgi:hypothetical protein